MPLEFRRCGQERLDVLLRVGHPKIVQRSSFSSELLGFFKIFLHGFKDLLLKKKHRTLFPTMSQCDRRRLGAVVLFFRQFGNGKKLRSRCCLNAPILFG